MEKIRVNLKLDRNVWQEFSLVVPGRTKSRIVNELLKKEIKRIKKEQEEKIFAQAFKDAFRDKERLAEIDEWAVLDSESWD